MYIHILVGPPSLSCPFSGPSFRFTEFALGGLRDGGGGRRRATTPAVRNSTCLNNYSLGSGAVRRGGGEQKIR